MRRPYTLVAAACLAAAGCAGLASLSGDRANPAEANLAGHVTISRDGRGVPFIVADDRPAAAFGLAYAMAEDSWYALEEAYAAALGRSAAWYGEQRLDADALRVALRVETTARELYVAAPPSERALWDAFAAGLNFYMRTHPAQPPRQIARYEGWMPIAYALELAGVRPIERAASPMVTSEDLLWIVRPKGEHATLAVSAIDEEPYEMNLRTADGWSLHAFGSLGLAIPREGFNERFAYATAIAPAEAVVAVPDTTGPAQEQGVNLNTANGVVPHTVRWHSLGDRLVIGLRSGELRTYPAVSSGAEVLASWLALMGASDAAQAAAAVSAGALIVASVDASGRASLSVPDRVADSLFVRAADNDSSFGYGGSRTRAAVRTFSSPSAEPTAALFNVNVAGAADEIAMAIDEWEQAGARNPERALVLDSAIATLRAWDGISTTTSVAMSLYADYLETLNSVQGDMRHFRALELVVQDRRRFPPRVWGSRSQLGRPGGDASDAIPVAAGPARLGIMFAYDPRERGQRYVWVAETGTGVGQALLSYGQSADRASPFWFNQGPMFAAGRMKQAGTGTPTGPSYRPGEPRRQ